MRSLAIAVIALAAGCASASASSATEPIVPLNHLPALAGNYFAIDSLAVGQRYHIYVRLPEDYGGQTDRRYPVVYLLDGDSTFPYLAPHHLFLHYDDKLPEAVLVGIAYGSFAKPLNRRHIDFMPPADGVATTDAGAEQFLEFLKDELIPQVDRRFRTDPERRILVGQSRGGAMVLYSAFAEPDLFWGRIASNASFEPGEEIFFGPPPKAIRKDLKFALVSGTAEESGRRKSAMRWSDHWSARPAPWQVHRIDIPEGTHAADLPNAYRHAMRWLFDIAPR